MDGRELVAAYFDNTLDEAGQAQLAAWIAQSPEHARFFAEWSVLEDQIGERYGVAEVLRADKQVTARGESLRLSGLGGVGTPRKAAWLLAAAAVLLLATLAAVWAGWGRTSPEPRTVDAPPDNRDAAPAQPVQSVLLVDQRDAVWGDSVGQFPAPVPGEYLGDGEAQLVEGVARLRTEDGTVLIVEAPARFRFEDRRTLRLDAGRVYGDATGSARPFSVKSGRMDVNGCNRSFGVWIEPEGQAMCQVYAGTAEVLTRGDAGEVEFVSQLMPNQSITLNESGQVQRGRLDTAAFVRTLELSELGIGRAYVHAVRASGPTDYWRFEQIEGGDLYNEVAGRPALRLQSIGGGLVLSDDLQNRHLKRTEVTGEFLVTTEKLSVNSDRYTIECWVRNDHAQAWTTLFAFQAFPEARTELEFGLIQLEMLPEVAGEAEAGHRFMLSHADSATRVPADLFTRADRQAASWHHIVVVRDGPRISLFRDGQRWAVGQAHRAGTTMDVILVVGRNGVTPGGEYRLFRGSLDEVALYDRPLTEQEIRDHYRAVRPPQEAVH